MDKPKTTTPEPDRSTVIDRMRRLLYPCPKCEARGTMGRFALRMQPCDACGGLGYVKPKPKGTP